MNYCGNSICYQPLKDCRVTHSRSGGTVLQHTGLQRQSNCQVGFTGVELIWSEINRTHVLNTLSNYWKIRKNVQEAQLSPSDRAMRLVSSNLANYHAAVQKLLIRQVLTKQMVRSWRFSWRQCVINKPTTVELCISPVYRRLAVAKFSKSTM